MTWFTRSRTNTSRQPLVSPATRLVADDSNTTYRPSSLIVAKSIPFSSTSEDSHDAPSACSPGMPEETETRSVSPACLSNTNTSRTPFVSSATRVFASEKNTTYRPFGLMPPIRDHPELAGTPDEFTDTHSVTTANAETHRHNSIIATMPASSFLTSSPPRRVTRQLRHSLFTSQPHCVCLGDS